MRFKTAGKKIQTNIMHFCFEDEFQLSTDHSLENAIQINESLVPIPHSKMAHMENWENSNCCLIQMKTLLSLSPQIYLYTCFKQKHNVNKKVWNENFGCEV